MQYQWESMCACVVWRKPFFIWHICLFRSASRLRKMMSSVYTCIYLLWEQHHSTAIYIKFSLLGITQLPLSLFTIYSFISNFSWSCYFIAQWNPTHLNIFLGLSRRQRSTGYPTSIYNIGRALNLYINIYNCKTKSKITMEFL